MYTHEMCFVVINNNVFLIGCKLYLITQISWLLCMEIGKRVVGLGGMVLIGLMEIKQVMIILM